MFLHGKYTQRTVKRQGSVDFIAESLENSSDYYICHVQAPTSAQRKWEKHTSHPFTTRTWSVFHNGVLTNHEALSKKYIPNNQNPVDTSVIPGLLEYFTMQGASNKDTITETLNLLQGTFAVCIVNNISNTTYIARQGSILHYNNQGEFSTMYTRSFKTVEEGELLVLNDFTNWEKISTFKTNSPFLFL